jgi:hypothetical protein
MNIPAEGNGDVLEPEDATAVRRVEGWPEAKISGEKSYRWEILPVPGSASVVAAAATKGAQ